MRTKTINVYKLSELEGTAKGRALNWILEGTYNHEWWDSIYDDAKTIGLKITSFDLDRNRHAKGEFINSPEDVCTAIFENHGESCETYKTAKDFMSERAGLIADLKDGEEVEETDKYADIVTEFKRSLLEDYSIMLQKESDYMSSEEYLTEMAEANDYEFDSEGRRV